MSAKSQSTCDRRTTHHARVSDISASKSLTQVVNHLGSCTDELFTFLDNPALDSDHELRDLALEYKDSCCCVLEFCTTLRELASEVDWFIHELERTVRHMERLWGEAASAGEHGDHAALFREGLQRQWPQGVQNAYVDMYSRVMVQVCTCDYVGGVAGGTSRAHREVLPWVRGCACMDAMSGLCTTGTATGNATRCRSCRLQWPCASDHVVGGGVGCLV